MDDGEFGEIRFWGEVGGVEERGWGKKRGRSCPCCLGEGGVGGWYFLYYILIIIDNDNN